MTISHLQQEKQELHRLADVIIRRQTDVESRWLEQVRMSLGRLEMSPPLLRIGMPQYLMRLADGLRQAENAAAGGQSSWESVAQAHAEGRVCHSFDIDELVEEFIILRQVLFRVVKEEGMLLDVCQSGRLADLIEGAIAAAVKSYVRSRDEDARRAEARHIEFITHELRNPLASAVLGAVQLRRTLSLSSVQEKIFAIIERNHHRLGELIDGVLLLERDAQTLKAHCTTVSLEWVLEPTLAAARQTAAARRFELATRFEPDLLVHVDPKLTRAAIDNVVQNALKYADDGRVEVSTENTPNEVVFHVRYNCRGTSGEELQLLFEPFSRGHPTKPATGLALAIARRALQLQGGTIHAESHEGRACHFWLTLRKPPH